MPTNKEFLAKKVELDDKQDKLTAGDNITINPNTNTISANYPDVIGATSSTAGTHGLVPAPAAGDESKFLKGDGTWDTVSAGSASLAGLTDVDLNNPADGQALVYDATNQEWVNGEAGNADYVELTQAEYDVLTEEEKHNGTIYFITDGEGGGGGSARGLAGLDWANKVTVTTSVIAPQSSITYTPPKGGILIITGYGSSSNVQATLTSSLITDEMYFPLLHNAYTTHEVVVNENDELTIGNGSSSLTMADLAIYFVPFLNGSSGSNLVHYSADEHIVGTDVDGATIYEQTFTPDTLPALSDTGQNRHINTGLTGISEIWVESNSLCSGNMPFPYVHYDASNIVGYWWDINSGNPILEVIAGASATSITIIKLTVRYKKSIV